jgi:hypothetical protein
LTDRVALGRNQRVFSHPHQDEGWRSHQPASASTVVSRKGDVADNNGKRSECASPSVSQEGIMADPDFPLSINRRRLLTSAAATVTATGSILPGVKRADAAGSDFLQSSRLTPKIDPADFCSATARRLLEIARRNELRHEAKLPLLPIAKELRRMKKQEELEEFSRFEAAHGKTLWEEVLKPRREAEGPNWRPNWMEGVRYQSEVYRILSQQFCAAPKFRGGGRPEIASRSQSNLMAT